MAYDPHRHGRRSVRLRGYDHTKAGTYYVTICTQDRDCLFGEVVDGQVMLSVFGQIVCQCWTDLPRHYSHVVIDAFVVMPNHVHGVIALADTDVGAGLKPAPMIRHPLSEVVRGFKTFSARRINALRDTPGNRVCQRNYYEHIIRGGEELGRIREYIARNPGEWEQDEENPAYRPAVTSTASRPP